EVGVESRIPDEDRSARAGIVARHRDERELGKLATSLSSEQFREVMSYREALRNWPDDPAFPDPASRPEPPAWLAEEDTN
ncbi:phage tail protein, partial [Pseudomonas aeruginosa]